MPGRGQSCECVAHMDANPGSAVSWAVGVAKAEDH